MFIYGYFIWQTKKRQLNEKISEYGSSFPSMGGERGGSIIKTYSAGRASAAGC
jgi:hypothetical protein